MLRRTKGTWIVAGLASLAAMIASGSEVQAKGITVSGTGGPVSGTDPQFYYDFQVSLSAGFTMQPGDFFTINGVVGVTPFVNPGNPGSSSMQPPPFGSPLITITSTDPMTGIVTSSVEWQNPLTLGGGPGVTLSGGTNGLVLGDFIIYTTQSIPTTPETVTYVALSHDPNGNAYNQNPNMNPPPPVTIALVPEPSSFILLLGGLGTGTVLFRRQRSRRSSHRAAA